MSSDVNIHSELRIHVQNLKSLHTFQTIYSTEITGTYVYFLFISTNNHFQEYKFDPEEL
jgi:hypothetical protein